MDHFHAGLNTSTQDSRNFTLQFYPFSVGQFSLQIREIRKLLMFLELQWSWHVTDSKINGQNFQLFFCTSSVHVVEKLSTEVYHKPREKIFIASMFLCVESSLLWLPQSSGSLIWMKFQQSCFKKQELRKYTPFTNLSKYQLGKEVNNVKVLLVIKAGSHTLSNHLM